MRNDVSAGICACDSTPLAACGGNNDPDPSGSAPGSSQAQEEPASRRGEEGSRPSATESPSEGGGWNQAEYAEYTKWCAGAGLPPYPSPE